MKPGQLHPWKILRVILEEWVPEGTTVSQHYYKEVLIKLREKVRQKRPQLLENGFIVHRACAHRALSVKQFLTDKHITTLEHPPYSHDLAPYDFYLFPKVKSVLKGTRCGSVDDVKKKTADVLKQLTEVDFPHVFDQWKTRLQQCISANGEYIK